MHNNKQPFGQRERENRIHCKRLREHSLASAPSHPVRVCGFFPVAVVSYSYYFISIFCPYYYFRFSLVALSLLSILLFLLSRCNTIVSWRHTRDCGVCRSLFRFYQVVVFANIHFGFLRLRRLRSFVQFGCHMQRESQSFTWNESAQSYIMISKSSKQLTEQNNKSLKPKKNTCIIQIHRYSIQTEAHMASIHQLTGMRFSTPATLADIAIA